MSRLGIVKQGSLNGQYLFTHRDPHTGRFWSDEIGKDGAWIDSKNINFDVEQPKKTKDRFVRKERGKI